MAQTWVIVADEAAAKILSTKGDLQAVTLVEEHANETARHTLHELVSDRPGRSSSGGQRYALSSPSDTKAEASRAFARRLVDRLTEAYRAGAFVELKMVAAPAFLGELRKQLPKSLAQVVTSEAPADLTKEPVHLLGGHLATLFA